MILTHIDPYPSEKVQVLSDTIEKKIEGKKIGSIVFFDIAEAFDKVWH